MHLLLPLLACTNGSVKFNDTAVEGDADTDATSDSAADTDTDTQTDTDTDAQTDTDTGPLPDVSEWIDPDVSMCQTYYGEAKAGAKTYWSGSFTGNRDEGWNGRLRWTVFANDTWAAAGGADCVVEWAASGPPTSVQYCADCDVGYYMSAFVDRAHTTCPESIYFNYQSMTVPYEIRLRESGDADWYQYGYVVGAGYWAGEEVTDLNYLGSAACVWF